MDSQVDGHAVDLPADYNVAPTRQARVLVAHDSALELRVLPWGLRQRWSSPNAQPRLLINARSESVLEKPSFRHLIGPRRCIVPMDGFYEWKRNGSDKHPYFCARTDGCLMLVAGIWEPPTGDSSGGFCVLTRQSSEDLLDIHDRCPVHLGADDAIEWMTATAPPMELCSPDLQPDLACRAVSRRVNSVRNNGPDLLSAPDGGDNEPPTLF